MSNEQLKQLARVYSFSTLRKAKALAKTRKTLKFIQDIENFKLNGATQNKQANLW